MAFKAGNLCAVKLTTDVVKGMGTWSMAGVSVDLLDTTSFGDLAKTFITGMKDYGEVTFSGLYDPADSTGQGTLISANLNNSKIANARLYVDASSYWTPNVTADSAAGLLMQNFTINADVANVVRIDFTGRCTGAWVLV